MKIYPSLISADLLNLRDVLNQLDDHCDGYHLDVMDDHFVPNLTWGPDFINRIRQATSKQLDIHLMVDKPTAWLSRLKLKDQDMVTFHIEAVQTAKDIEQLINDIHALNLNAGIALNPTTALDAAKKYLEFIDHLLLMSVNPGFSGQSFIPEVIEKVQPLVQQRNTIHASFLIGMDGGVTTNNIAQLAQQEIDYVCAASAIFSDNNPIEALNNLYNKSK